MAVCSGTAVAGQMLHDRQHTPRFQALGDCLGNFRDLARFAALGTIADDGVAAGSRNIRDRKAIDVDAQRS